MNIAHTFVGQYFHNYLLKKSHESNWNRNQYVDLMERPIANLGESLHLYLVPFLSDNYCYILLYKDNWLDKKTAPKAIAVDPADPLLVRQFLEHHNAQLMYILTTHRHADHAGGNKDLKQMYPQVEIIGGQNEKIPAVTRTVRDGETFTISLSEQCRLMIDCITTPCHTSGHVVYIVRRQDMHRPVLLFTGDHLFIGGCGRFFEGSAKNMYDSMQKLKQRIRTMFPDYGEENKDDILVLCGHEYTIPNLQFVCNLVPNNSAAQRKYEWAVQQRSNHLPTVPSPWYDELQYNPYLRVDSEELKIIFQCFDPIRIISMLGERK